MSTQNKEAAAFISRLTKLPKGPVSLDSVLQPSLDDEAELRKLFATDKANARLKDPYVGLVDVFDAPDVLRTTRARDVNDDEDLAAKHIMPLGDERRRADGAPAMIADLDEFKKNWAIFTEGSLSQLSNWDNIVAAGGSVLASLSPIPEEAKESKRAMRQYFHDTAYKSSDVDLFLYGLTPQQAEAKIIAIYEAVRDSVPWDVTCVRTRHTVSIHSQYPYRCVQIVLRLYRSPAEILAGFDVDCPCFVYNGSRVFGNPRAIVAMMRQANTVDMTRRSPSYEVRLAKYSLRGFEIYVPNLKRDEIDPTIYERSITRVQGLARLLVLEKLSTATARASYLVKRSQLRGRPNPYLNPRSRGQHIYHGDFKSSADFADIVMSDYDVVSLQIPYGPLWNAKRIEKLVYKTDLGMNSPWNPKNKGRRLHRHPAFFGTAQECVEDCCCECPEPEDAEEHELQDEQDQTYVRGRLSFIEEDPGRQTISGSFNPIDEGEWSEQAYVQAKEKFFNAIAISDVAAVLQMIADGEAALDVRDQVGRTPLHVAIISGKEDVAIALIDAGARMTPRLVGGRSSLHLAAQYGQAAVVKKMLERSALNAQKAEEAAKAAEAAAAEAMEVESDTDRPSSEDDWSSEESDGESEDAKKAKAAPAAADKADGDPLEDDVDEPDILDISLPDWDFSFTPLGYAILSGSAELVDVLLAAGADATQPTKAKQGQPLHPLTMTLFTPDEEQAARIAEKLIDAGASSSAASPTMYTIFHRIVSSRKASLVSALLRKDPNAKAALDFPAWTYSAIVYPVITAIQSRDYSTLAVLVAHGAKLHFTAEDISRAEDLAREASNKYFANVISYLQRVYLPVETAITKSDDISLLLALGAPADVHVKDTIGSGRSPQLLADWAASTANHFSLEYKRKLGGDEKPAESAASGPFTSWAEERTSLVRTLATLSTSPDRRRAIPRWVTRVASSALMSVEELQSARDYFLDVEKTLRAAMKDDPEASQSTDPSGKQGAASQNAPSVLRPLNVPPGVMLQQATPGLFGMPGLLAGPGRLGPLAPLPAASYIRLSSSYRETPVPLHLKAFYDELYEACWAGDNARIEELCLPKSKPTSESQEPIQIAVRTTSPRSDQSWTGYTPLFVALSRRHWSTVKLIVAIAQAQYKSPEEKPSEFIMSAFVGDSDSDEDSDVDEMDIDSNEAKIDFHDIAKRPSSVQCDCKPSQLFTISGIWPDAKGEALVTGSPLQKAIYDDDFEAFVNIIDLYDAADVEKLGQVLLSSIMAKDRVEMLDEIIRRTGDFLPIHIEPKKTELVRDDGDKKTKTLKDYSGLKVGEKRKKDFAPNLVQPRRSTVIIWQTLLKEAAAAGAMAAIDYLSGARPLEAYQYYADNHDDQKAKFVRGEDFERSLPKILGWKINELDESPMTSAILEDKFEVVKKLVELEPDLMREALRVKSKFVGFTGLLTAAFAGAKPELFDFLLKHGCDPEERDARGWNVLHLASVRGHKVLVAHIIKTFPEDLVITLMGQISKGGHNTPLMLAVKKSQLSIVEVLTSFPIPRDIYAMKDSAGSSALHAAAEKSASPSISRLLATRGPVELLHSENGVGQSPLEIVGLKELTRRSTLGHGDVASVQTLTTHLPSMPFIQYGSIERALQAKHLRGTLDRLIREGVLEHDKSPATEFFAFADKLESKHQDAVDVDEDDKSGQETPSARTLDILREAERKRPGARQLVHILDVQRSVERNLAQVSGPAAVQRLVIGRARRRQQAELSDDQQVQALKAGSVFSGYVVQDGNGLGDRSLFNEVDEF